MKQATWTKQHNIERTYANGMFINAVLCPIALGSDYSFTGKEQKTKT